MGLISFIEKTAKQTAVYWGTPVPDGYGGFTFAAPIEIKCRWEDKQELFTNRNGVQLLSSSIIVIPQKYTIEDEGWLFLGSLNDLDSGDEPVEIKGAFQIQALDTIPLLSSSTEFMITAYLAVGNKST